MYQKLNTWKLFTNKHRLVGKGKEYKLEPKMLEVLLCLIAHNGQTVSKAYLTDKVWADTIVTEHSLNKTISKLRKVFDDSPKDPQVIETISKKGYRLLIPVTIVDEKFGAINKIGLTRKKTLSFGLLFILVLGAMSYFLYTNDLMFDKQNEKIIISNISPITTSKGVELMPDLSTNGQQLVYTKYGQNLEDSDLYIRQINSNSIVRATNSSGFKSFPKFSPNGKHIAYVNVIKGERPCIYTISTNGTNKQKIVTINTIVPLGLDWSPDGKTLVFSDVIPETHNYALYTYNIETGTLKQLTFPNSNVKGDESPMYSHDGKTIAFIRRETNQISNVGLIDLSDQENPILTLRTDFSLRQSKGLSWTSKNDGLIYFENIGGSYVLKIKYLNGEEDELALTSTNLFSKDPIMSSDGKSIAYVQFNVDVNIYKASLSKDSIFNNNPIIQSTRNDNRAKISQNGSSILYSSNRSGYYNLWYSDDKGQNQRQITDINSTHPIDANWSEDGTRIVFSFLEKDQQPIYIMELPDGLPIKLLDNGMAPSFSKYNDWVYFGERANGNTEIKKISLKTRAISSTGAFDSYHAMESPDGKTLFFIKENQTGIWKINKSNEEEKVIDNFYDFGRSDWSVTADGIYYIIYKSEYTGHLLFYKFSNKVIKDLGVLSEPPLFVKGISVFNNDIFYTITDDSESEIIMMELNKR